MNRNTCTGRSPGEKRTIIYIAGYGRSGSTLLERILGSHENIVGTGELSMLLPLLDKQDFRCSCGESLGKCSFWSDVIDNLGDTYRDARQNRNLQLKFEAFPAIGRYLLGHHSREKEKYKKLVQKIVDAVGGKELPPQVKYIVDSSKTSHKEFFRPIALSKFTSLNVKMIHLVRDGRGCMWSLIKGSNRKMEKGVVPNVPFATFRAAMGWFFANIAAHVFQSLHPSKNYCRIKYEDLTENYLTVLTKLEDFLDVNFDKQMDMLKNQQEIPLLHQVGGNRLKFRKKIVLRQDIQWKTKLRKRQQLIFWLLDWPLALIYNYK